MSGIFISYRRDETAAYAGRLRDRLVSEFGANQVFMDVDTIELGVDFTEAIDKAITGVTVFICVMGPEWATLKNEKGVQRLSASMDFVNLEVSHALKRNIRVIPLLVKDAEMPSSDELPAELKELTKRNALHLSDTRFHSDIDLLIEGLRKIIIDPAIVKKEVGQKIKPNKSSDRAKVSKIGIWGAVGLLLGLIGIGLWYSWNERGNEQLQIAEVKQAQQEADAKQAQRDAEIKTQQEADAIQAQHEAELKAQQEAIAKLAQREAELNSQLAAKVKQEQREAELKAEREAKAIQAHREAELKAEQEAKAIQAQRDADLKARELARAEQARIEAERGEVIYTKIKNLDREARGTTDCTRIKAIIESLSKMSRYTYPLPTRGTIAELVKDRTTQIKKDKPACFLKRLIPLVPTVDFGIKNIR